MKRTGRLRRRRLVRPGRASNQQLEDACKAVVYARDGKVCAMCGTDQRIQWSHVYGRGAAKHLVYEPINSKPLCGGCHRFKWHNPPVGFDPMEWFRQRFPGRLEEIQALSDRRRKSKWDRNLHLLWLQQELKRLKAGRAA